MRNWALRRSEQESKDASKRTEQQKVFKRHRSNYISGADLLQLVCPKTSSVNFDDASEEPAVRVVITERFGLEALTVPESSKPNLTHVMAR